MSSERWHVKAVELPEGTGERHWWVTDGRLTRVPVDGAVDLRGAFVAPALVDAHAHLTLDMSGGAPPDDRSALIEANARTNVESGVLTVRDVGEVPGSALPTSVGHLSVARSGPLLAPPGRYHDFLLTPAPVDEVVAIVSRLAERHPWIKVVADFPGADGNWFQPIVNYPADVLAKVAAAAHAAGARVAAHVSGPFVAEVVRAGIDTVEHGPLVDARLVEEMAERGTAWIPTLSTVVAKHLNPLASLDAPVGEMIRAVYAQLELALASALELGVPVLAGTDERGPGTISLEVEQLIRFGIPATDALRAATTGGRQLLRLRGLEEGAPADLVLYDDDPRSDPPALTRPRAVLSAGTVVAGRVPDKTGAAPG